MKPEASPAATRQRLIELAAQRYRPSGRFAYHFARGKLGGDPAFTALLARGLLAERPRVLDLGCGQGLLAAWLHVAQQQHACGAWPAEWPAPPQARVRGIELMASDLRHAQAALGDLAEFVHGDIRNTPFASADAVVILDVLHYLDYAAQEAVLQRVRDCLQEHGRLLLRVGDAAAGFPFRFSNWVDHCVTFARGHRLARLYCRSLREWQQLLAALGFRSTSLPLSEGTPFANVMLIAELAPC